MPILPDPRPYPAEPVKNSLLTYASQIAHGTSTAQRTLCAESLQAEIYTMLQQNHYLGLSVAMSMAPDAGSYRALFDSLNDTLLAKTDSEIQWFALPVVLVAGCNQPHTLPLNAPTIELCACLADYPHLRELVQAAWLPKLMRSADLAAIDAGLWFAAKQNEAAAQAFAAKLPQADLAVPQGQSVHVVFALGYGKKSIQTALNPNLREAALPLMQVWQTAFTQPGLTLFANPLAPAAPPAALAEGSRMRLRMALDVFAANAIRAVRLQSPRAGVVVAAQQGGRILFGFNATDSAFELADQVFAWPLSPAESIAALQQDFLDLMAECRVENIRLLHDVLPEEAELPTYARALKLPGHNPLFAEQS
ncbi:MULTISPECIES: conjugal transfer protein [unclassified Neisseria]|uniref:conjugal transfer protein n=1 Tax=unclassified Neisseria TaxID=2623750 RepID=UPI001072EC1B|nr:MULTISPECIES: conjugal transfer protein [unclassified Neisseria]MBF0804175.1 conjugal transfer protein [Neisseria sp. 19428wB4_WF04]TFU43075.1 conjugal transfer protein [Neisseria sp. WF04]